MTGNPSLRMINVGCGSRFHPDWLNFDLNPRHAIVREIDIRKGFPLETGSCDVVYHSHVLEHLSMSQGLLFLKECHRILRVGGTIRVVVPDLERICRGYLEATQDLVTRNLDQSFEHFWYYLELIDQMTREESGGEMLKTLESVPPEKVEFVISRIGVEARQILFPQKRSLPDVGDQAVFCRGRNSRLSKLFWIPGLISRLMKSASRHCFGFPRRIWVAVRTWWLAILLGPEWERVVRAGTFLNQGEVHRWMYDRFFLKHRLIEAGFREPRGCLAHESIIPLWKTFLLDIDQDGNPMKPDSLYMEATK